MRNYALNIQLSADELFGVRLQKYAIREHANDDTDDVNHRMLADALDNYLHVYVNDDGIVDHFTVYMPNGGPYYMFRCIEREFRAVVLFDDGYARVPLFDENEREFPKNWRD